MGSFRRTCSGWSVCPYRDDGDTDPWPQRFARVCRLSTNSWLAWNRHMALSWEDLRLITNACPRGLMCSEPSGALLLSVRLFRVHEGKVSVPGQELRGIMVDEYILLSPAGATVAQAIQSIRGSQFGERS
jgi:hypothetical protein